MFMSVLGNYHALIKPILIFSLLVYARTNEASFEKIEGENTLTMFLFVLAFEVLEQSYKRSQLDIFVAF